MRDDLKNKLWHVNSYVPTSIIKLSLRKKINGKKIFWDEKSNMILFL